MLEEIFKDDLELLENESVKKLLSYVQEQHKRSYSLFQEKSKKEDEILTLFMYSEIILIDGKSSKETLKLIGEILGR